MSWFTRFVVSRDAILSNRWVKPFAHHLAHPSLWHLNRRSFPRGVALGLFFGFILPVGQIPAAAVVALSLRANVIVAATATFVSNPLTFPPIYYAAYRVGRWLLGSEGTQELSKAQVAAVAEQATDVARHTEWTFHEILLPLMLGLICFALVASVGGYLLAQEFWKRRIRKRWRKRHSSRCPQDR